MPKLKSQDENGASIYDIRAEENSVVVECETTYDIDIVSEAYANCNSRKERRELADQYQTLVKQHNDRVNFKAFKPTL